MDDWWVSRGPVLVGGPSWAVALVTNLCVELTFDLCHRPLQVQVWIVEVFVAFNGLLPDN